MSRNDFHKKFSKGFHVLVCQVHRDNIYNKRLLEEYKLKVFKIKGTIPLNCMAVTPLYKTVGRPMKRIVPLGQNSEKRECAVYMFQRIEGNGKEYNLFFDSGCGDLVCKKGATTKLGKRANREVAGPKQLFGVGGKVSETHSCQPSRILRETHAFRMILPPRSALGKSSLISHACRRISQNQEKYSRSISQNNAEECRRISDAKFTLTGLTNTHNLYALTPFCMIASAN